MKIIFLGEAASIHTIRWVNSLSEKGISFIPIINAMCDWGKIN